jgi:hypothetical protein
MAAVVPMMTVPVPAPMMVGFGRRDAAGRQQTRRDPEGENQNFHRTVSVMRVARDSAVGSTDIEGTQRAARFAPAIVTAT